MCEVRGCVVGGWCDVKMCASMKAMIAELQRCANEKLRKSFVLERIIFAHTPNYVYDTALGSLVVFVRM